MKRLPKWLQALENPIFARLYFAQTINLVGDSLTWLGLAILAFDLVGEKSGTVLAGALTIRVMTFVLLSPLAGAIADRVDRKILMITTHVLRMGIVCLLPFITQVWQIYVIVFSLNLFYAFFTPTYTATIPLVTSRELYPQAIALSSATNQLLGVLGPGLAGGIAAFVGTKQVFFLDGITFLLAAILIKSLPKKLIVNRTQETARKVNRTLQDIKTGTFCLFADPLIRYGLILQLVGAIAGAAILVNTVGYIQGNLGLGKIEYGWVMAAFGIGATLTSVWLGSMKQRLKPTLLISLGAASITLAILPANWVNLSGILILWSLAGIGQTLVNVPTQTLIAQRVAVDIQGRVYGAHFAWSHLWWAFSYPIAGWLGTRFPNSHFLYSSITAGALLMLIYLVLKPWKQSDWYGGLWHEHEDTSDEHHNHAVSSSIVKTHARLHYHKSKSVVD